MLTGVILPADLTARSLRPEGPTARWPCSGRRGVTLMLSAKSSSALAPTVSMEVMRLGSLFLVLAAVP